MIKIIKTYLFGKIKLKQLYHAQRNGNAGLKWSTVSLTNIKILYLLVCGTQTKTGAEQIRLWPNNLTNYNKLSTF